MSDNETGSGGDPQAGNVVDLVGRKRRGAPSKDGAPVNQKTKQSKAVPLCRHWRQVVNGASTPALAEKFHVWEPEKGKRLLLLEGEGEEVSVVPFEALEAAMLTHSEAHYALHDLALTPTLAKEAARYWTRCATPVDEPKMVSWQGEAGLTFRRLPWAPGDGGGWGAPTWEGLLGRIRNNGALVAWIGSLFCLDAKNHQYVFLHGEGADGKGAINRFFAKVFGAAYASKQPPGTFNGTPDKFWTYGLVGKRIIVFPDCNNTSFMASGLFKGLTGGDPQDAEIKGGFAFTFMPRGKFMIFSNEKPKVSSEHADMRRIIYCSFDGRGVYDPAFEDRLWAEGGAFLSACIEAYRAACPGHGEIKTEAADIESWVEEGEADYQALFENLFETVETPLPDCDRRTPTMMSELSISALAFQTAIGKSLKNKHQRLDFTSWLERRHRIAKALVRVTGGERQKLYLGIRLKRPSDGLL